MRPISVGRWSVNPIIALVAVGALIAAAVLLVFPGGGDRTITAEFPRTVSLYEGSDVKILGVTVGKVDQVTPSGTKVVVKMHYADKYKVPAGVKAAVVSPSIVGDRFVQLTPAYTGGAVAADGLRLGMGRTATPLELDEIFGSLNDMAKGLGPEGANRPDASGVGPLTRLLDSTARNFGGQGVQFNQTLTNLAKLTKTLSDNKDEIFGTAAEVEKFTKTLATNDDTVRRFTEALASGAQLASGEREELAAVMKNLSVALEQVRGFVQENRGALTANIKGLTRVSKVIVKNRDALDESLKVGPLALNNLGLAYNETTGTLDTRANLLEGVNQMVARPSIVLCGLLPDLCNVITPLLNAIGLGRTAPGQAGDAGDARVDRSLAGLVEVAR